MTKRPQSAAAEASTNVLDRDGFRQQVMSAIDEFAKDIFATLQRTGEDSVLSVCLVTSVGPIVRAYHSDPSAVQALLKTIWPDQYIIVERYLVQGELAPEDLASCIRRLLASDDAAVRVIETLLIFAGVIPKLEEIFHNREWLLWQLRKELAQEHKRGRFQRIEVSIPSEQLLASTTSRGDLQITVSASKPTIVAGEEFSVFVVITNPFEVPIMLYSVETQIPVELIDIVERQRRLLELRPRSPDQELVPKRLVDNLLDATWNRWRLDLQLGLEPGNRIAQAIAASEARRQIPPAIAVSMEIGAIQGGSVIGTQIGKYQSVDLNIESAAPQHLDSILWRIESYKRGLSPIALQPGDSVVKQFIFRTRSWLLFTPLAHNMQIQVRYSVDNRDHLDTVPFQLTIQAAITATMTGAVIGGLAGGVARSLSGRQDQAAMDGGGTGPVSIVLAMMLSAIVVVSFARKSGVQQVVSVEDFWGGLFIGFLIGFWGQSFALNLLAPSQGTTSTP